MTTTSRLTTRLTTCLTTLLASVLLFQARADITTGLIGYWTLDEGSPASTIADATANNNPGMLMGFADPTFTDMWTNGWFNNAVGFNQNGETGNYIAIADAPSLDVTAARQFTLAAWFRMNTFASGQGPLICKGPNNGETFRLDFNGNKLRLRTRNSSNASSMDATGATVPTRGLWYHVVAVYCSTNTPKSVLYVNGVKDGDSGSGSLTTLYKNTHEVSIGNRESGNTGYDTPFQGTVDEVHIYNRWLSASDVFQLYTNNGRLPLITAQPRDVTCYSNDTAVFSVKVDSTLAILPFGYQWQCEGTNVPGGTAATLKLPGVTSANAGTYTVLVTNAVGTLASAQAVLTVQSVPAVNTTSGLAGWWKLDEESGAATAADSSANANGGTLSGFMDTTYADVWEGGIIGGALRFNGDASGANVVAIPNVGTPAPAALDFSASPVFTLSAWVNASSQSTNAAILAKGTGSGGEQYVLEINSGTYRFFVRDAAAASYACSSSIAPSGFWQHVAAVFNAGKGIMSLYVNGALVATAVAPTSLLANHHEVTLGNRQPGADIYAFPLTGALDDVRIYNRDLTAADVFALYSAAAFPIITAQYPVTYTNLYVLYAGASPTFRIGTVTGLLPMSYQWYLNDAVVPGATNPTYQLHNLPAGADIANYCVVTNSLGSATSFVWTATVVTPPSSPYAQSVLNLAPLGYWRLDEADANRYDGNPGAVLHDYLGGNNGVYTNSLLSQTGYGVGLAGQYGYGPATDSETSAWFGYLTAQDSFAGRIQGVDFTATNGATTNFTVECWVNGLGMQPSAATILSKGIAALNDAWSFSVDTSNARKYRFSVRTADGTVLTATSKLNADYGVWHHLVGVLDEPNGAVNFYIDGLLAASTPVATNAGAYNSAATFMTIGSCQNNTRTGPYSLQFNGSVNDVALYNYALSASQVQAHYLAAGIGPRFTQAPPSKVTVTEPQTLTIPTAVFGTGPHTYSWTDSMGSPLMANQTNASLVLSSVPGSLDGDNFYLSVSSPYGMLYAGPVPLTVIWGSPQFTAATMPARVYVPLGKSYTYSVSATGTLPFSYQWSDGGSPVPNQTNATYVAAASSLGIRTISVAVSNSRGMTNLSSLLTVVAPPSDPYATALLGLQPAPVGYWPLQETGPSAPVTMETNQGTLGALGNAYYAMNAKASPRVTFGQPGSGALVNSGDNDPSVAFTGPSGTNYAFVPQSTSNLTIRPPFTVEAWVNSSDTSFADILGQGGSGTNSAVNSGNAGGFRLAYAGNIFGSDLGLYLYTGSGQGRVNVTTTNGPLTLGVWHHCVASYDGTTAVVYVDGQRLVEKPMTMAVDTWSPLTIGDGLWMGANTGPNRPFKGSIDEVAVYTNVLTDQRVLDHFTAGMTPTASNYVAAVRSDKPLLHYRMNAAGFIGRDANLCPVALNYGSAASYGGLYQGGVIPGGVPGPSIVGLSSSVAAPINGVISCVDAGNDPTFNATNTQPFTALVWFKANPADARFQGLLTHGANWALNLDGTTGKLQFTPNNSTTLTSPNILNDGAWHLAAGVYDGAIAYLYVDGALSVSRTATGSVAGDPTANIFLGGNTDYTSIGINQRFFDGAVAQAAFFTNALTATQVQSLYAAAVPVPTLSLEHSGAELIINYTGTLLSSPTAAGPYTPVDGATSPYTVSPTEAQRFYRARVP